VPSRAFVLSSFRNIGEDDQDIEVYDEDTGLCIFGFTRNFASLQTAARWKSICQAMVEMRAPIHRGKAKQDTGVSKMVAVGVSAGCTTDLRYYVTKPSVRAEPEGAASRTNLHYEDRFVWEFLSACGKVTRDEIIAEHREFQEKYDGAVPPPLWMTRNYMVGVVIFLMPFLLGPFNAVSSL
jgi:hypothetical protein